MAHEIEFREEFELLYVHYDGELTDEALLHGFEEDLKAIRSRHIRRVVVDLADVSRFTLKSETNLRLAERGGFPKDVHLVFVAPCDIQFGMARMFELASDLGVRVVRTLEEASDELRTGGSRDQGTGDAGWAASASSTD